MLPVPLLRTVAAVLYPSPSLPYIAFHIEIMNGKWCARVQINGQLPPRACVFASARVVFEVRQHDRRSKPLLYAT